MRATVLTLLLTACSITTADPVPDAGPPPEPAAPECDGARLAVPCRTVWQDARYGVGVSCTKTPWLVEDGGVVLRAEGRTGCIDVDPNTPNAMTCCR